MATVPSTSSGDVTNTTTRLRGTAAHAQLSGVRDARSCSGSSPNDQQPDHVKDEDIDPFSYHPRLTKLSYTKVVINTLWLLPLRLIFIVIPSIVMGIIVCVLAVVCSDKYDKNNPRPLSKWGKLVTNTLGRAVARVFLFGFGFNWIHTRGELAPTTEAPILIVSPHSCFLDMFVMCMYRIPTFLSRADIIRVPLFGWVVSRTFRPIFVEREKQGSRNKAVSEIRRYASSNGDWPPVVIFPEGTTTNTKALIGFKQGAFLPKLPIQPVVIQYNRNKLNTTSWSGDGLGMLGSLYLTLCQFHNSLEVEFLPVYHPSDEEKNDSKVYARNVQQLMAK